jgi:hypothetical protein
MQTFEEYESVKIGGTAEIDPDFNRDGHGEGTGVDKIKYRIPVTESDTRFDIDVSLLYQSISPRFARDLFKFETGKIKRFQSYYQTMDQTPIEVCSAKLEAMATSLDAEEVNSRTEAKLCNYPNPFNNVTNLEYSVVHPGQVSLRIFDLLGRRVNDLICEVMEPGNYTASWDGKDVQGRSAPSGVYLAVLSTTRSIEVKRILLLR